MEVGAGGIVMGRQGTFRVAAWDSEKFSHRPHRGKASYIMRQGQWKPHTTAPRPSGKGWV